MRVTMRSLVICSTAALCFTWAPPASAAPVLFDFGSASTGTLNGGSPNTYTASISGIGVTITAFHNVFSTVTFGSTANVTFSANNGLGVDTNSNPAINDCSTGQCQNNEGETLLLVFDQTVTLSAAQFAAFDAGEHAHYQSAAGALPSGGVLIVVPAAQLSGAPLATWTPIPSLVGSQFYIASRDHSHSSFWLRSVTVAVPVPVPLRLVEYSAKFLCGDAKEVGATVRPGIYETSINIHNPQFPFQVPSVIFFKKVVLALREGEKPIRPSTFRRDILQADFAEQVDCKVIRSMLGEAGNALFIEGFVVLIVFPSPPTVPRELDVVGVYTVDTPQQSISLEMMPIAPRILTLSLEAGRKLRDQMLEQTKPE